MVLRPVDFEVLDDGELGRFAGGGRNIMVSSRNLEKPLDPQGRVKSIPCSVVRILCASQVTSSRSLALRFIAFSSSTNSCSFVVVLEQQQMNIGT
jgi:hypothetical protein